MIVLGNLQTAERNSQQLEGSSNLRLALKIVAETGRFARDQKLDTSSAHELRHNLSSLKKNAEFRDDPCPAKLILGLKCESSGSDAAESAGLPLP
jgi:hypothetical protein